MLVAIDVNGVKPAVTAAKAAGIPVIAVDAQIPQGDNVAFVGVDNGKAGQDIGTFFADYVKSSMGGKAKVGIVGALNSFIQNQRLDGFKKTAAPSGVSVAATVDGQTTAHYLTDLLSHLAITVTKLAHGVPVGGELDYLDEGTLAAAIRSRTAF